MKITIFLSRKTFADIVLLSVSLTWGIAYPLMHIAITGVGPYNFLLAKYFFSTLLFAPFVLFLVNYKKLLSLFPYGVLLGFLYFMACLFQAEGLHRIPAGRNAFITGLVVIFVPILSPIFHRTYPKKIDILTILLVLVGMYILLNPLSSVEFKQGDILSLIGTIFFTLHIQTLQKITQKFNEPKIFAFFQVFFITLFSLILIYVTKGMPGFMLYKDVSMEIWLTLFVLGAIVMLAFFVQAKFQNMTTATRAVVIYNLQPALAAMFSYMLIGEKMTAREMLGAAIVVFSVIGMQIYRFYKGQGKVEVV